MNSLVNNPLTLVSLFSALCFLTVFARVWGQKRETPIHNAFLLFTFDYFCVILFEYLIRQNYSMAVIKIFSQISAFFFTPSGFLVLNLIYVIINKKKDVVYKVSLIFASIGTLFVLMPDSIRLVFNPKSQYYVALPSLQLSIVFLFSSIFPACFGVFLGLKRLSISKNQKEKNVLKFFLSGLIASILFGILMLHILPFFLPKYVFMFYEFSSLASTFLLFFLYKAVNDFYLKNINYTELEQVSSSLFSNLDEGVVILGKFGEVVDCNKKANALLGKIQTSKDISEKIEDYNIEMVYVNFNAKLNLKGDSLTVKLNQTTVEKNGDYLGKLLIIKDITSEEHFLRDQKKLEKQIQQSEKMQAIGQLAGGVAHDFNNQLAAIMGCADLIEEEIKDNEYLRDLVNSILTSSKKASSLTQQLLAYAQKGKYLSKPVDIHNLINDVIKFLSRSINKKIVMSTNFEAENFIIEGDMSQLNNVFLNLALNARDAMKDSGEILFVSNNCELNKSDINSLNCNINPGKYLKIDIKDTGCGMSDEIVNKIFDPFFTTKELGSGTGMGLAAVYGTIKNHHGHIIVESTEKKGTTFSIYLPLFEMYENLKDINNLTTNTYNNNKKILIIDDEKIVNMTTAKTLQKLGYKTTSFEDSSIALDHYKNKHKEYDAIILDLIMPIIDGYEMFNKLKFINKDANIIIASGYSLDSKTQELLDNGACCFIQKPFRKGELKDRLSDIFNGVV